jgi:hypothetical protein
MTRAVGTLYGDVCTLCCLVEFSSERKMIQDESCGGKNNRFYVRKIFFFPEKLTVCEIM